MTARCDREISAAEAMIRAGEPREDLLLVWWADWQAEKRMELEAAGDTECRD